MTRFWKNLVLMVGLLLPTFTFAQVEELVVGVDGMYCPFCTQPTLKVVRKVDMVEDASMDMEAGTMTLHIKPDAPFKPESVVNALGKSSYVYRSMLVTATGTIGSSGAGKTLNVPENDVTFILQDSDEMTFAAKKALDAASGKVQVTGYWEPSSAGPVLKIVNVKS